MRYACREHALAEYSLVLQTERYLRLYRKILGLPVQEKYGKKSVGIKTHIYAKKQSGKLS
jgi:hypothetical protein